MEWHFEYTIILSYVSLKSECRTYLTTHVKKEEDICTYFHLLFFDFIFKQVKAQNLNKAKLGSTLLGGIPNEVAISVASFFGGQAIWLEFDSLILFHYWTFNF